MRPDSSVFNATKGNEDRIGQLFALRGKEHETPPRYRRATSRPSRSCAHDDGDTFSTKDDPVTLPIQMPEPLLAFAITPKTKGDEDKLSTALSRLREEDPTPGSSARTRPTRP